MSPYCIFYILVLEACGAEIFTSGVSIKLLAVSAQLVGGLRSVVHVCSMLIVLCKVLVCAFLGRTNVCFFVCLFVFCVVIVVFLLFNFYIPSKQVSLGASAFSSGFPNRPIK